MSLEKVKIEAFFPSQYTLGLHQLAVKRRCAKIPLQVKKDLCKLRPLGTYRKPPALIVGMMPVPSYAKQNDHYQDCVFGSKHESTVKRSKHQAKSSAS